jgi:hypothetical protein
MANPVQWTIDQVYSGIQVIYDLLTKAMSDLDANRTELTHLWTATKSEPAALAAVHQKALAPLIHQNSVIRLTYVRPVIDKYKEIVSKGSKLLESKGYHARTLADAPRTGLGLFGVDDLVVLGGLLAVCTTAVIVVQRLTQAQINATETQKKIMSDSRTSVEQKLALSEAAAAAAKQAAEDAAKGFPLPKWEELVPILGLVALLVFAPTIKALLPRREAA